VSQTHLVSIAVAVTPVTQGGILVFSLAWVCVAFATLLLFFAGLFVVVQNFRRILKKKKKTKHTIVRYMV
jgi:hypothetical protein